MGLFERLELRDVEILRTMARLHFVTSAEINAVFFSSEYAGYRRLRKLSQMNLIRRHTNGAPPRSNYCAWRLTGAGIDMVIRAYPEDLVRDGLEERLSRQSLAAFEHREAVSRLYLDLIRGPDDEDRGSSRRDVSKWAAAVRARADQFQWQGDGDVVVEMRHFSERYWIVPDATASTATVRLFIELDRSTKSLKRIEENLKRYAGLLAGDYGKVFPDRKPAWLVYVVRSHARAASITKLAREKQSITQPFQMKVLLIGQGACAWLASMLLGQERNNQVEDKQSAHVALLRDASAFLTCTNTLLEIEAEIFEKLRERCPNVMNEWRRTLGALYQRVRFGGSS